MRPPFADSPEFARLLRGEAPVDLVAIALELARDAYPDLDAARAEARIARLVERARDRCATLDDPRRVLGQINWVLYVEEGFRGNTEDYYDPRNSYLNDVLERKTGIPITLALIYARVAETLGLRAAGVNLPAHFMLRVESPGGPIYVDAFHEGALLDADGCRRRVAELVGETVSLTDAQLAPCPPHVVVGRMLRNLKAIHLREHDYPAAVPVQRRLAALAADDPMEQRDLGMLFLRLDRPAESVAPLQAFLDARPDDPEAEDVRVLLRAARLDVALRN